MDDPTPQDPAVARHAGDDLDTLDGFVARFVWPLVAGGRVHVEDILGPGVIAQWARAGYGDASLTVRVGEALRKRLSRYGPAGVVERVPLDALALAAVWHNLLAMTHPEVVGRAGLRRRVREWCLSMLEWVDAPRARDEAALRHAMLGRLGELGRVDTHVEFWAGYADFVGVAPPRSLMAWPSVRRVNARRTRVGLFELIEALRTSRADPSVELVEVARAALALSPLTDLSLVDRPNLAAFAWTPSTVNLLGDMALRGAAQRAILAQGTPAARALEQATLTFMRGAQLARPVASAVLRMHLELLVMDGMAARMGAPQATSTSGVAGAAGATVAGAVSQPLALDAYLLLGPARAARWLGLDENTLARAVPPDPSRPTPRDPPSAPLLVAAGLMEART